VLRWSIAWSSADAVATCALPGHIEETGRQEYQPHAEIVLCAVATTSPAILPAIRPSYRPIYWKAMGNRRGCRVDQPVGRPSFRSPSPAVFRATIQFGKNSGRRSLQCV